MKSVPSILLGIIIALTFLSLSIWADWEEVYPDLKKWGLIK